MSGTPGRTLLGFQQQYQYTRPSSSKGRPTSRAAAPSGSQDATSSPVSSPAPVAPAPLADATTSPPIAAAVSTTEPTPSKAPSPPPVVAAPSPPPPPAAATAPSSNAVEGPGPQPVPQTTSSAVKQPSAIQTAPLNIDKSNAAVNVEAANAATTIPTPTSQPSSTDNDMAPAPTVEQTKLPELVSSASAANGSPESKPSRPVLVNYGSKRRMNSSDNVASVGAESQPGPTLSPSSPAAPPTSQPSEPTPPEPHPSQPAPPASTSHAPRSSSMSASSSSLGVHSDAASGKNTPVEASPLASLRGNANASTVSIRSNNSASTSLRRSRRGYDGEADPAALGPTQPRDLLAAATAAATSSTEPEEEDSHPDQPTPLSFLDEYSATPSPKARKRGVLLSPGGGRASRRFGSSSMSSGGESGSAHSRETSRSETVASAPAPPSAPSVVEDDAMSLAFHEAGSEAGNHDAAAEGEDFPRGAVIFETMSSDAHSASGLRTPRSLGSDGAESGKAAGSVDTQGQGSTTLVDDAFRASLLRGTQQEEARPAYDDSWLRGGESAGVKQRKVASPPPRVADKEPHAPLSKAVDSSSIDEAPEPITRYGLSSHSPAAKGSRRGYDYSSPPVEQPPSSSTPPPPPLPARRRASVTPSPQAPAAASSPLPDTSRSQRGLKRSRRDDWESHILKADWEELEVSRYLSLFGKDVHEVRSAGPLDPHNFTHSAFPSKLDWTTFDGDEPKFNAAGYYLACTTALLSYLSPTQMVDLQRGAKPTVEEEDSDEEDEDEEGEAAQLKQEFRLATLRASGQRLYYSALPLWESLGSRLRRTWRWESKWRSFLSLVAYTFLWWRGLLIASLIFSVIMLVLGLKSKPPPPDTLRDVLARQRRREEEERRAKTIVQPVLTAAPPPRSQYSLVVEASQNYGLTISLLASALADGHERAKNFALWRSPRATWRLLFWLSLSFFASLALKPAHLIRVPGAVLGLLFFFLAPIVEHKPHWLGTEWSNPFDWIFAGVPNDAQYSMEVLRSRAQQGKPLVGDPALLMRPDEEPVSATVEDETTGAVDWTRWADLVLRGKSMAIRGTEVLAGSRSLQLPRVPVGTIEPSTSRSSALLSHLSRGVNFGLEAIENRSKNSAAQQPSLMRERGQPQQQMISTGLPPDEADLDGTFWALYDGCCGHVVITPQMVLFRSLFAKRPRGRRGLSLAAAPGTAGAVDDEQPLLDARGSLTIPESELSSSSSPPPKVKVLFQCKLDAVKGIKKLSPPVVRATRGGVVTGSTWSMAAGEGLRLVLKGRRGEVEFFQVRGRDEAFNRLLALAPQQWQRVN